MGLAVLWSNRISRITSAARALSRGDRGMHLDVAGSDEVALLARSLNRMRDRIEGQLAAIAAAFGDRKSTRLNSSHKSQSRMPSSA